MAPAAPTAVAAGRGELPPGWRVRGCWGASGGQGTGGGGLRSLGAPRDPRGKGGGEGGSPLRGAWPGRAGEGRGPAEVEPGRRGWPGPAVSRCRRARGWSRDRGRGRSAEPAGWRRPRPFPARGCDARGRGGGGPGLGSLLPRLFLKTVRAATSPPG